MTQTLTFHVTFWLLLSLGCFIPQDSFGQVTEIKVAEECWIRCLAFSPSGDMLATGGDDHLIQLWDTKSGKLLRTLKGHPSLVYCVKFSPDGKLLASGSYGSRATDETLMIWDVKTGQKRHGIPAASSFDVYAVDFTRDSQNVISGGDDHLINIWDVKTAKGRLIRRHGAVVSLHLLPDEKHLLVGGWSKANALIDSKTGKLLRRYDELSDDFYFTALSPDGKSFAATNHKGTLKLLEVSTGKLLNLMKDAGTQVKFSPDSQHLATVHTVKQEIRSTIRVWNIKEWKLVTEFREDASWVEDVVFFPDGKRLASRGTDSIIRFWDLTKFIGK